MTDFPTILYRTPGPHKKPRGGSYAYCGAANQAEFDALIAKGWFASYDEAVTGKHFAAEDPIDEVSPPTRDELEAKARNLGSRLIRAHLIKSWGRRIAEALEG